MGKKFQCGLAAAALCVASIGAISGARAQSDVDQILKSGKITVGIYNQSPWAFTDADGKLRGFDADLIKAALEPLGIKQFDVVTTQFPALIPGLTANRFDVVAGGLYITPERCKLVAFGDPDLKLSDAALVKEERQITFHSLAEIAKQPNLKFGTTRGSVIVKDATASGIPEDRQILFPDNQSVIAALLADRIDVAVFSAALTVQLLSDPQVKRIKRVLPFTGYVDPQGHEHFGYAGTAFRLDETKLRDLYDEQLAKLKASGKVRALMKEYGFTNSELAPPLTQAQICAGAT